MTNTPRRLIVVLAALTLGSISAGTAVAAPGGGHGGGGGGGSGLTLVMVADANGNQLPNWGDTITFSVSTTATTEPHVSVQCSQNGTLVYSAATGYYASYPWPWTQNMALSSYAWSSGAADCTATLYYFSGKKTVSLTPLGFHVDP